MTDTSKDDVAAIQEVAESIYKENNALQLASTGGVYSPWILGVYFASIELDPVLLLETSGKTFKNLQIDKKVAFSISQNDAMKDFAQGSAVAELLDAKDEASVRAKLVEKMSWYQTYTPCTPVRLRVKELFVSSFSRQWFPAKVLKLG